ncbi:MAG: MGH1-like glycoside hydrolase domain-containing protein [Terriglobia bacterium]
MNIAKQKIGVLLQIAVLCCAFGGVIPAAAQPMSSVQWHAQWIWPSTSAIAVHDNQFIMFRKTFTLTQVNRTATLAIFADSRYRLWVNGTYIGQGPARAPHGWHYYDTFNVASDLRSGLNVIAVEARWYGRGEAWYVAPPSAPAPFASRVHGALLCQLSNGDGPPVVASDATWRAQEDHAWDWDTPQMNALGNIEVYHADRVVRGWTEPRFDDHGWVPVTVTRSVWGLTSPPEEPYTHLAPRPMAYPIEKETAFAKVMDAGVSQTGAPRPSFFRRGSPLSALGGEMASEHHASNLSILSNASALTSTSPGDDAEIRPGGPGETPYVILDLGREEDGYLQFSVDSTKPETINIGWSEMMEHGDITANAPGGNYVAQYDVGPGSQHWTMWGWHGMRFVELSFPGLAAPLRFHARLRFSTAKLAHAGSFESSSPLLTKLWQMGAYTFQLCSFDGTMDCPTREQRQWLGDGEVELRVNGVANGNLDIAQKFLRDAARDEWRDGAIPMVSDTGEGQTVLIDDYIFSFVNALDEYYLETGDKDFVLSVYPSVVRAMMWFQAFRLPDGLLGHVPYWVFLDWSNPDKKGESSILNALYAHTLENAAQLAEMAGDSYHARIFRGNAQAVRAAFDGRFWDASRGLYVDAWDNGRQSEQVGQLANADAILFGFAPPDRVPGIIAKITDPSRVHIGGLDAATNQFVLVGSSKAAGGNIVQAQTYGMFFVLETLAERGDAAAVRQYIEKLWGPMVQAGNGTFWENFIQRTGTSCHAWSAAPTYFLTTVILGVRPTSPGYSEYRVAPQPAGLEWAKGTVPTVHGPIQTDWKWEGAGGAATSGDPGSFVIHLHNPAGETARVVAPERNGQAPASMKLNGKTVSGRVRISQEGDYTIEARYR